MHMVYVVPQLGSQSSELYTEKQLDEPEQEKSHPRRTVW